uniref:Uncharacterized protein n=1 Tax=Oryza nivara TaxID=4536 RepID=A0A0E0GMI0_ORYNI
MWAPHVNLLFPPLSTSLSSPLLSPPLFSVSIHSLPKDQPSRGERSSAAGGGGGGDEAWVDDREEGARVSARPHASSASSGRHHVRLPKLAYSTDPVGCSSSQAMHAASSSHRLSPAAPPPTRLFARSAPSGPMVYTRGNSSLSTSKTSDSRSSNESVEDEPRRPGAAVRLVLVHA